ncbi:hypothetical protein NKI96_02860, partial [Mesorhizobium sp. M0292]|uniref:hypothetical protein n=1 Tax=Mesorhizobium sp. M0292 TaxID=2956929 RepID=UPI00333529B6
MYIKAIHTIQRDPKSNPPVIFAGSIDELDGRELDAMLEAGAARPATEEELIKAGIIPSVDRQAEEAAAAEKAAQEAKDAEEAAAAEKAAQ